MKVLLVNGGPHKNGYTFTALTQIADTLKEEGVESEIYWIGSKPISGCLGCRGCAKKKACVIDDKVNEFLDLAADFDGFIFGSPVHWAGATGAITSFLDRVFYADFCSGRSNFYLKPAAAIMSARRDHRHLGPDEQILRPHADAHRHLPVLEHGPRGHPGAGKGGPGGDAVYAFPGPEHGLVPPL